MVMSVEQIYPFDCTIFRVIKMIGIQSVLFAIGLFLNGVIKNQYTILTFELSYNRLYVLPESATGELVG